MGHIAAMCLFGFCADCVRSYRDPEAEAYEEAQQRKPDGHIAAFRPVAYARTVCGECYIGDCYLCAGYCANGGECECSRCEARRD